jgi:hypothetical protein
MQTSGRREARRLGGARTNNKYEWLERVCGLLQVQQRDLWLPCEPARLQVRVAERARNREARLCAAWLWRRPDDEGGPLRAHRLVA